MAGPVITVEIKGLDRLMRKLAGTRANMPAKFTQALYMEAEETITDAKKLTPVMFGHLRNSGHVQPPEVTGDGIVIRLGFGGVAGSGNLGATNGQDVGYAVLVHENLTARHVVGQAKYLETPLNSRRSSMSARLTRRLGSLLNRTKP